MLRRLFSSSFIPIKLDRILAGSIWGQVRVLVVIYCVILLGGWLLAHGLHIDKLGPTDCDSFWWTFVHTMDPGFLGNEANHTDQRALSVFLSLAGFFLFGGLLVSVLVNAYERRMRRTRQGLVRYVFKKDHGLVLGWDRMGPATVRHLFAKGCRKVVVLTLSDAEEVRSNIKAVYSAWGKGALKDFHRIFIFHGSFDSPEELHYLRPWAAREIVILGDTLVRGSNSRNLQTAMRIAKMAGDASSGKRELLPCRVAISHLRTFDLLQEIDLSEEDRRFLDFRPFNFHEGWARKVWCRLPGKRAPLPSYSPLLHGQQGRDADANVAVAVIGFGQMGQAMAIQAARLANHANGQDAEIVVFDPNLCTQQKTFATRHGLAYDRLPGVRFSFHAMTTDDPEARDMLTKLALSPKKILTVVVCLSDPDQSMSAALGLPPEVLINDIPILVRQETTSGLSAFARRLREQTCIPVITRQDGRQVEVKDTRWDNVRFFGSLDEYLLDDGQQERLAKAIHRTYLDHLTARGWKDEDKPAQKPWERLSEKYRWSNRYQADAFLERLMVNGFELALAEDAGQAAEVTAFDDDLVETMAEQEHNRWWVERVLAGWEKGQRDDLRMSHPNMVPFAELDDGTREFDRAAVRAMPELLRKSCGLVVTVCPKDGTGKDKGSAR